MKMINEPCSIVCQLPKKSEAIRSSFADLSRIEFVASYPVPMCMDSVWTNQIESNQLKHSAGF